MSSGRLPDPPMIITDIPTNQIWKVPSRTGYIGGGGSYENDSEDKYYPSVDGEPTAIKDLAVMPNSTSEASLRRGLTIAGSAYTNAGFGQMYTKVMVHDAGKSVADYISGWREVPGAAVACGTGNFGFNRTNGRVFAQRQGEYTYGLLFLDLDYGSYTLGVKFNRSEFSQTWFQESFYLADFSPVFDTYGQFFVSDDANPFIWHVQGSYDQAANGDDLQQGSQMFGVIDDGSPVGSFRFYPDVTGENPYSATYGYYLGPGSGYHFTGKAAAFRQKYSIPRGQYGHGPYIVHPWRSGNYNPPELWFFLYEFDARGYVTGRFKIYRSAWKQGQYKRYDNPDPSKPLGYITQVGTENGPVAVDPTTFNLHPDRGRSFEEIPIVIDDDPAYNKGPHVAGGTRYPKLNPHGFAFEHEWFNASHFVGYLGPFPNCNLTNPAQTAAGYKQNASHGDPYYGGDGQGTISPRAFQVIRDRKRRGQLHVIMSDFSDHSGTQYNYYSLQRLNGIWFSQSGDDGAHWARPTQAEGPHGFNVAATVSGHQPYSSYINLPYLRAERLFQDATVMAVGYGVSSNSDDRRNERRSEDRYGQGARNAMFVVDYQASGVGKAHYNDAVFKNGEQVRAAWL